jgi:hypothetical protein
LHHRRLREVPLVAYKFDGRNAMTLFFLDGRALAANLNLNAYQCYHLSDAISDEIAAIC